VRRTRLGLRAMTRKRRSLPAQISIRSASANGLAASSDDYAAFFFNALRFLVAVSSNLSGCSCVLKAIFSNLSIRS
jgi:hypothetical protein